MVASLSVGDMMTADPVTAGPGASFKELVDLMIQHDIGAIPVLEAEGVLQGIVTESDLLARPAFGAHRPTLRAKVHALLSREQAWQTTASGLVARDIMSTPVSTIAPTAPVAAAARQMIDQRIGRLVVVDDGHVVGIISRRDLLRPFDRPDEEIAADVQAALDDPTLFEHGHRVSVSVDGGCVTLTGTIDFPSNVAVLHDTVMRIRGIVGVDNRVSAELPEPRPGGAALPEPPYPIPR